MNIASASATEPGVFSSTAPAAARVVHDVPPSESAPNVAREHERSGAAFGCSAPRAPSGLPSSAICVREPSGSTISITSLPDGEYVRDASSAGPCRRKITVLLNGRAGNLGLSYNGMELLPELFRRGCWLRLFREGRALVGTGQMRWRGFFRLTLGPWCPAALWLWLNRIYSGYSGTIDIGSYSAINRRRFIELDLAATAKARNLDLAYRPWKDAVSMRLYALLGTDPGNQIKGVQAGWHIDRRDPTADVRLLEYCLAVPTEQFLHNGTPRALARRALADRLPKLVLDERRRGLQAADWHEWLTAVRNGIAAEIERLDACPAATRALDLPRLHRLVENWPADGWERDQVYGSYRLALARGISKGHFLRRTTGANV